MRKLIAVGLVALLGGCAVGPDYERPKTEAPAAYQYQEKEALDTANTLWWNQFQDPVLDDLIAEALAHNLNVQIAAANVEAAAALLTQERASLYPQVGYSGSGTKQRSSESEISLPRNPRTTYQTVASASWEIDLWGRIRRLSEAARANLMATDEARRGVILSLVSSVAGTYMQLRALDQQLVIAKSSLATYEESVKLFELQFEYGQVSQMTVEQARSQYETAAVTIPAIESQIAQLENALSVLLGRNPGSITRGKTIEEIAFPAVPAGLPSDLLENRPDIRKAEQDLIAANAQIGAAKALYFPTISLTGVLGYASSALSDLFEGPSKVWNYSGSITGPIFAGGAIRGTVKQAEAIRKAALLNYQLTIQSAFADVDNALVSHRKLVEQIAAQGRLVKASSEYERLARLQYDGGYVPYSTVLQAQQQLFPAELNYAQYRATLFNSLINIYKAVGGGWVHQADQMTAPVEQSPR